MTTLPRVPHGTNQWRLGSALGALGDGAILLVAVLLFPLVIILIGAPVALLVRMLLEVVQRW
ncbi:MAG: hypothetical protein ABL971_00955 [Vicinamibacterales bacterium]